MRRQSRQTGQPRPRRPAGRSWPDGGARRRSVALACRPRPDGRAAESLGIRAAASAGRRTGLPRPRAADPAFRSPPTSRPRRRPVAIDGSRELVDGGNHREAVFWVVATAARCQAALNALAPALAAEREPAFRALVADLTGLRTPADVLTRRDALLADLAPPPTG